MGFLDKMKASRLSSKASNLLDEGRLDEAETMLHEATGLSPASPEPWHNLGLVHQHRARWREALECHQRALELDPSEESWWWDVGINAGALGDWETARAAWKRCDVEIPDGQGPFELDMGTAAVRIRTAEPEVVWVRRLDPSRAILESVPLPSSKRRFQDLVAHDGVRNGARHRDGQEYPVYDELGLIEPSSFKTFGLVVNIASKDDEEALIEGATAAGLAATDWRPNIRFLCDKCLQGLPHERHDHEVAGGERLFGIAAKSEADVHAMVKAWAEGRPGCELVGVDLRLGAADG